MSRTCQGCGAELPPPKRVSGRRQKWCSDRCRKAQYSVPCIDCGKPLNGSDGRGPNAAVRCTACAPVVAGAARKVWTRDACVQAIRDWAAEHDGIYPTTLMWNPTLARSIGLQPHPDYVANPDRWPCFNTVLREWGSWRAAVVAAGFVPRERGGQSHMSRVAA